MDTFFTPVALSWTSNDPMHDIKWQLVIPCHFFAVISYHIFEKENEQLAVDLERAKQGEGTASNLPTKSMRLFKGPTGFSYKELRTWLRTEKTLFGTFSLFNYFAVAVFTILEYISSTGISGPEYSLEGDAGMRKWLLMSHIFQFLYFLILPPIFLCAFWRVCQHMKQVAAKGKHLMSATNFKQHVKAIDEGFLRQLVVWAILWALNTPLLMPAGLAMQRYGITNPASWWSPTNSVFNAPGSAQNLLGAPVYILVCKVVVLYLFTRWTPARNKAPKASTKNTRVGA